MGKGSIVATDLRFLDTEEILNTPITVGIEEILVAHEQAKAIQAQVTRIKMALQNQQKPAGKVGDIDEKNPVDFEGESSESGNENDEGTEADKSIPAPGRFELFSKYRFDNRLELHWTRCTNPSQRTYCCHI